MTKEIFSAEAKKLLNEYAKQKGFFNEDGEKIRFVDWWEYRYNDEWEIKEAVEDFAEWIAKKRALEKQEKVKK